MRKCYHKACDDKTNEHVGQDDIDFMATIAQTLVDTVIDLAYASADSDEAETADSEDVSRTPKLRTVARHSRVMQWAEEPRLFKRETAGMCSANRYEVPRFEKALKKVVTEAPKVITPDETTIHASIEVGDDDDDEDELDSEASEIVLKDVVLNSEAKIEDVAGGNVDIDALDEAGLERLFVKFLKTIQNEADSPVRNEVETGAKPVKSGSKPSGSAAKWFSAENGPEVTYNIGTQINIGSLSLDVSKLKEDALQHEQLSREKPEVLKPNIILGSGDVNPSVISNIIHGYYNKRRQEEDDGDRDEEEKKKDRRHYQGKFKNSPMIIKLLDGKSVK